MLLRTLEWLFINYHGNQSCLGLTEGTSIITRSWVNEVENKEQGGGCWSELNTRSLSLGVLVLSHAFSDPLSSHLPNGFANIHFAFGGHYDAQGDTSY